LVYELVDEMIDFGYPQELSTESVKAFIQNSFIGDHQKRVKQPGMSFLSKPTTVASAIANKSVIELDSKEEIFIDLFEYVNVTFDGSGGIVKQQIEGEIKMRSFLKGNPKISLTLNEDLQIGRETADGQVNYGKSILDYCIFHECCQFNDWNIDRTLNFFPPLGSSVLLRYSLSDNFTPPFVMRHFVEELGPGQLDVFIELQADFPSTSFANKFFAKIPLPKATRSASCELSRLDNNLNQETYEYDPQEKAIIWRMKIVGGSKSHLKIKLNLEDITGNHKREIGPVSLSFEIAMYICSNVFVKSVKIAELQEGKSSKWVRSITRTGSYIQRIDHNNIQRSKYF